MTLESTSLLRVQMHLPSETRERTQHNCAPRACTKMIFIYSVFVDFFSVLAWSVMFSEQQLINCAFIMCQRKELSSRNFPLDIETFDSHSMAWLKHVMYRTRRENCPPFPNVSSAACSMNLITFFGFLVEFQLSLPGSNSSATNKRSQTTWPWCYLFPRTQCAQYAWRFGTSVMAL